jgi:hypothetical protein
MYTLVDHNDTTYRINDTEKFGMKVERLTATGWEASCVAGHWLLSVGHNMQRAVSASATDSMKLVRQCRKVIPCDRSSTE